MHLLFHPMTVEKFKAGLSGSLHALERVFKKDPLSLAPAAARILVYHGICSRHHLRYNTLFLDIKSLEQQLRLFKKYFQVITLSDYFQNRYDQDRFAISLTFDDGFANNYKYVLPLLEQHQIPATFFITAIRQAGYDVLWNDVLTIGYRYGPKKLVFQSEIFAKGSDLKYRSVSTGQLFADILRTEGFEAKAEMINILGQFRHQAEPDFWQQLTVEEIRKLSQSKWVTIGSHGYYHNDLARIPLNSAKNELRDSKQFLEGITRKEVTAMAFPYGSYSKPLLEAAEDCGYNQILGTELSNEPTPALKARLTVNPFISVNNQLRACIIGKYA